MRCHDIRLSGLPEIHGGEKDCHTPSDKAELSKRNVSLQQLKANSKSITIMCNQRQLFEGPWVERKTEFLDVPAGRIKPIVCWTFSKMYTSGILDNGDKR